MITVGINKNEELHRFEIYKTYEEASKHWYPTALVVKAVNSYSRSALGYIVMDECEADFRRVTK